MKCSRFDLGFTRNRKVAAMSDAAFRLWVSAIDYAREQLTDGVITDDDLDMVPRCPKRGTRRTAVVAELEQLKGLEVIGPGRWQVHDFLEWQESRARADELARRARERMTLVRANKAPVFALTPPVGSDEQTLAVRANNDASSPELRANAHACLPARAQVSPSGSSLPSGSDLPSSEPSGEPDRLRARGATAKRSRERAVLRELPEPFPVSDEHRKYAETKGYPAWWLENRHEHFCELAAAKGWKYSDWNRALYTFLRNEIGYRRGPDDLAHLAPKASTATDFRLVTDEHADDWKRSAVGPKPGAA